MQKLSAITARWCCTDLSIAYVFMNRSFNPIYKAFNNNSVRLLNEKDKTSNAYIYMYMSYNNILIKSYNYVHCVYVYFIH